MKTLDEVITELEDEGVFPDALNYLKMYRSDKAQYEADLKNWELIKEKAVDEYNEARERLIAKCKALEIGTLNPPLTWDELKTMLGKPVWVEDHEDDESIYKRWFIVEKFEKDEEDEYVLLNSNYYSRQYYGDETDGWQAYRKERE